MFEQCLYFNTTALARTLEREWTQAFHSFDLTPAQAFMLRAILDRPGVLPRELAAGLNIARPTASRTLDGLQQKGLIQRTPTENDGREWSVQPTRQAEAIKAALNEASGEVTRRLKRELGTQKFSDVVALVRNIRSALE